MEFLLLAYLADDLERILAITNGVGGRKSLVAAVVIQCWTALSHARNRLMNSPRTRPLIPALRACLVCSNLAFPD
jgi:hypothetical protein